jgi:hypothetical protein
VRNKPRGSSVKIPCYSGLKNKLITQKYIK